MNPVQRFFRRYIFSTIGILTLFFVVNIALALGVMIAGYMSGTDNGLSVREVSGHVTEQAGTWTADGTALAMLIWKRREENDPEEIDEENMEDFAE